MDDNAVLSLQEGRSENGVRFGRNRFLAAAGGVMFGVAASLFGNASVAWGDCGSEQPCVGYPRCCCCSGSRCCLGHCVKRYSCWSNNHHCWQSCGGQGRLWRCCDWTKNNGKPCICRTVIGRC